jgi:hypothetical protein
VQAAKRLSRAFTTFSNTHVIYFKAAVLRSLPYNSMSHSPDRHSDQAFSNKAIGAWISGIFVGGSAIRPISEQIVERFGMRPLSDEGGYYVETYRSPLTLAASALPPEYAGLRHTSHGHSLPAHGRYLFATPPRPQRENLPFLPRPPRFHGPIGPGWLLADPHPWAGHSLRPALPGPGPRRNMAGRLYPRRRKIRPHGRHGGSVS